jgi:hypothetical protein
MPRAATGSAFESRGKFYAVVTVAKRRWCHVVPVAKSLDEAKARAAVATELARKLHAAGQTADVETAIEQACTLPDGKLAELRKFVDRIAAGKLPAPPQRLGGLTFGELGKLWTNGELNLRRPLVGVKHSERAELRHVPRRDGSCHWCQRC